jgi:hypothetical protein
MLTAPAIDIPVSQSRRFRAGPLVLSVLVHVVVLVAWLDVQLPEPPAEPAAMVVDLVPPPPSPPADEAKPAAAQPRPEPEARQIPQLQEGALGAASSPVAPAKPVAGPPALKAEIAPPRKKPPPVTQTDRDFVLSQVLRNWKPPRELAAYDKADVHVAVTVGADGYFAEAYDARRPWNPNEVFDGYAGLHPQDIQRRTIDAFYRAIRQAQPVKLPPELRGKAPFNVRLDFRFRDIRF